MYSFDSGEPGPHVMINSLTHGNEVCGAIVVKALLDRGVRPRRGRLTLAFATVEAFRSFDPARPDAARFVDQDSTASGRVPFSTTLPAIRSTCGGRAMLPVIDTVDVLLDIHSMHEKKRAADRLWRARQRNCAGARFGNSAERHQRRGSSRRTQDARLRGLRRSGGPKNALLIECGQHWEAAAVRVAKDSTARFLALAGVLDPDDFPADWFVPLFFAIRVVRVTEPVVAASMDFRFVGAYTGLEAFPDAGTGWRDGEPVVTPYPKCVLVMPSLRQLRPGVTVVRLGSSCPDQLRLRSRAACRSLRAIPIYRPASQTSYERYPD